MASIRPGYPTKLTDDEIVQLIAEYQDDIFNSRANVNTVIQLAPMVELGIIELQKRNMERTNELNASASRLSKWAMIIAVLSLVASLGLGIVDYFGSQSWQEAQIKELETQTEIMKQNTETD